MDEQLLPEPPHHGHVMQRQNVLTRRKIGFAALCGVVFMSACVFSGKKPALSRLKSGRTAQGPLHLGLWSRDRRCDGDTKHELMFHIRARNQLAFEELVYNLGNPESPQFRQWLTQDEVHAMTRNEEGIESVKKAMAGIQGVAVVHESSSGEFIKAVAPISVWEEFFDTEFHLYTHRHGGKPRPHAKSYTLPAHLEDHVAGILGVFDLDDFPIDAELPEKLLSREIRELKREEAATPGSAKMRNQSLGAVPTSLLSVEDLLTPQKLRDTYKLPAIAEAGSPEQLARSSTSQAVFASLQQYWSPRDRLLFEAYFDLPRTQVDELDNEGTEEHTMASSDTKCRLNPNSCMEANLDVQYMLAMSPWSKMGLFYMSAQSHKNLFAEFVLALSEMKDPPRVVSISYGGPEVGRSADLIRAFNYVASKIAAQGVTILASSGDDGANGLGPFVKEGVTCRDILDSYGLVVNWPASSPWVTAVGATMGAESSMEEIACATNAKGPTADASPFSPSITSGGGFSQAIPRPRWQPEYKGQSGRGVPDVSLAGHAYAVVVGGKWTAVDGTSASAPAFAGMLSLVNAQLNLDRKEGDRVKSVGWLNPVLYRHKEAFTDVTEGNNFCARAGKPCCGGYDSGAGWDPVTGLGTVNGAVVARLMGVAP